jgi:hypothetical protein
MGEVILPNGFTSTENVGDARYIGFEAATELDVLELINGGVPSPYANLTLYGNVTLLDAGQIPATRRRMHRITRSKPARSIVTKIRSKSRYLARSLTVSSVTMAIPSKASFPLTTFGT